MDGQSAQENVGYAVLLRTGRYALRIHNASILQNRGRIRRYAGGLHTPPSNPFGSVPEFPSKAVINAGEKGCICRAHVYPRRQ